jgi:hypothetical protein
VRHVESPVKPTEKGKRMSETRDGGIPAA